MALMTTLGTIEESPIGRTQAGRTGAIRGDSWSRRAVDLALATPALLVLSPFMAALALAVKLETTGPAIFEQERVGKAGRRFLILKFRSMVSGADRTGPHVTGRGDARITRVGRFLRSFKLDELPQLFNIIKGEMTLLGPRPEVPRYLPYFTEEERATLLVRPGLTGAGQIFYTTEKEGELDRAEDPEAYYIEHQLHEKLAADLDYLRRRSAALDLTILFRTAGRALGWRRLGRG